MPNIKIAEEVIQSTKQEGSANQPISNFFNAEKISISAGEEIAIKTTFVLALLLVKINKNRINLISLCGFVVFLFCMKYRLNAVLNFWFETFKNNIVAIFNNF